MKCFSWAEQPSLCIRHRPAEEIRPTDGVDILIEFIHYKAYAAVEAKLRTKGFANDTELGVICRYKVQEIVVDVMPTSEVILGFSNRWYAEGFSQSIKVSLEEDTTIRIFHPVYFLATKLEAFNNRGGKDGTLNTDFDGIICILNNRKAIWTELAQTTGAIRTYLVNEFKQLIAHRYIEQWISSHLAYSEQRRVSFILLSLENFTNA